MYLVVRTRFDMNCLSLLSFSKTVLISNLRRSFSSSSGLLESIESLPCLYGSPSTDEVYEVDKFDVVAKPLISGKAPF